MFKARYKKALFIHDILNNFNQLFVCSKLMDFPQKYVGPKNEKKALKNHCLRKKRNVLNSVKWQDKLI